MNVLAFNGSPRRNGNTSLLLAELLRGVREAGGKAQEHVADELLIKPCKGCLRCNVLRHCALRGDDWTGLRETILAADALVFASPVYFHHLASPMKKLLDRFRSFVKVRITPESICHIPWQDWNKKFVLLLCMGSSDPADAQPVVELFRFMTGMLGPHNSLDVILGTRLAVLRQVAMPEPELAALYEKLGLPVELAAEDCSRNRALLQKSYELGRGLVLP
jgi:NAD(P)H-dependent FMN reductase